jgi:glyoxylase-like metal-dependent hydrolase (beta-lactamase superfamily II)
MFPSLTGFARACCLTLTASVSTAPVRLAVPPLRTHVILLGTGTPNADPTRSGPAVAIIVDSNTYIVDAGAGIVRRAAAAKIAMSSLRIAFLTHLHSDHTVGLPDGSSRRLRTAGHDRDGESSAGRVRRRHRDSTARR